MAFEDITLLGKRISQLNPIPQDWSEEQVVELMTNGLIPLAKSNYDTFKTTLGFAFGYIPSWKNYSTKNGSSGGDNSIFIGKSTIIGNNSISLGDNNNGGNRIISLGFGNTSVDSGVCNFAELGYSNLVYNKVSEIQKLNNNVLEAIPTQSFIAGVANKSRHYNDIIIGYGNESQQPDSVKAGQEYDDDGFCIAMGFKNIVSRNYDIAIGHKSRAVGGENIALQHSDAEGYRNLALFNSNIVGTCNVASNDTVTDIYLPEYQGQNQINKYVTYNILHNSKFYYRRSENSYGYYSCNRNVLIDVSFNVHSDTFQQNFVFDGNGVMNDYTKTFSSIYVSNNVIFDGAVLSINSPKMISKNFIFENSGVSVTSVPEGTFYNNIISQNYISLTNSKHIFKNTLINAYITGTVGLFDNNIVANSNVYFKDTDVDSEYNEFKCNLVLGQSTINFRRDYSFWSGARNNPFAFNILMGANAEDCYGCFALSDGSSLNIVNAKDSMVVGDNTVNKVTSCFVFGTANYTYRTVNLMINGMGNSVFTKTAPEEISSSSVKVSDGFINGLRNCICGDNITRFNVFGSGNYIYCSNGHNLDIGGDQNLLQTIEVVELTGEQFRQKQINRECVGHFEVTSIDIGYQVGSSGDLAKYDGSYLSGDNNYFYYDNGILAQYNPNDITEAGLPTPSYTNITAQNFLDSFVNGTLTDKTYFRISSYTTVPLDTNLYKGILLIPTNYYGFYRNSLGWYEVDNVYLETSNSADTSTTNYGIFVRGNQNKIGTNIAGYSVFGMGNKVSNTLTLPYYDWCISNGFIQGNSNEASNGSNIVIFGNGNKSVGHNSVAIGSSLISSKWQTVIGKYNVGIEGPDRIIEAFDSTKVYTLGDKVVEDNLYYEYISNTDSSGAWDSTKWKKINPDSDKAIFIIGNGYSENDGFDWKDEQYMHRSNAMVVYADGTIKARNIVTDEPLGKLVVNGDLVDAATINVPNNKLSTLQTQQSNLILVVDVESDDYAPNFLVEIEARANVTLTIKYTVNGSNLTTLPYNTDAGNTLESGKKYQVSCCGHGWVLGELTQPTP